MPNQQVRKCRFVGFFIGVDGVSVLLVCDMASDYHKNGYLIGKHPNGAFDILLSLLFINTFNAN
jgi:hypothetical protein